MKISLIGMSNSGKSFLSKKLQETGFHLLDCDGRIAEKLRLADIGDVASWMGHPYEPQYAAHSARYLALEQETMIDILDELKTQDDTEDVVVDTTGSVIYTGNIVTDRLRKETTVIYLDTPEPVREEMYESYIQHPKPVIWGSLYNQSHDESPQKTLARCYQKLLDYRIDRYRTLAHITLDYFWLRHPEWNIEDVLARIA